jgi:hypothetical protein
MIGRPGSFKGVMHHQTGKARKGVDVDHTSHG